MYGLLWAPPTLATYCHSYLSYSYKHSFSIKIYSGRCSKIVGGRVPPQTPLGERASSRKAGVSPSNRRGGGDSTTSCLRAPEMKLRHCCRQRRSLPRGIIGRVRFAAGVNGVRPRLEICGPRLQTSREKFAGVVF